MENNDDICGDEIQEAAAFLGATARAQTMADGSLRITVDLNPGDAVGAFTAFGSPGSPVAIARITNQAAVEESRPKVDKPVKPYGEEAKALFQSGFFRTPQVWQTIGTDEEYLNWVKHQPSAIDGNFSEYHETGEKYCIPAHVRRVEFGSGTAHKPPYSAIPLTDAQHQYAHKNGDTALMEEEWWQKTRIKYVHMWAWDRAKAQIQAENPDIQCDSFSNIPPILVENWALRHNIHQYLPQVYKGHASTKEHQEASA